MLKPFTIRRQDAARFALAAFSVLCAATSARAQRGIAFEENHGQTSAAVKFVAKGKASTLLLTANEMILAPQGDRGRPVRMRLVGADARPEIAGADPLPGRIYYASSDARGPLTAVPSFRRVKYSNVYLGIDLEYYGSGDRLEFDFTVAPHADPKQIRLSFDGNDRAEVDANGELRVDAGGDVILFKRPIMYQLQGGARREVSASYVVAGRRRRDVRFAIGEYDSSLPLVIDPAIVYATYTGGAGNETIASTEVNKTGEAYLFGSTTALPQFLPASGRIVPGTTDPTYTPLYCFVQKLSADAQQVAFTVYFQGFRECEAFTVAPSGAVHLAMRAPYSFSGFAQLRTITGDDGSGQGLSLSISNLNGGALGTIAGRPFVVRDMKADSTENVYILYQQLVQADSALQSRLMKVSASGDVVDAPFDIGLNDFGPGFGDVAVAMDVDEFGQVFVAGNTNSGSFPATPDAFQQPGSMFLCSQDAFLMHVDTAQTPWATPYATVLGGRSCDSALGIVRDPLGSIYLMGRTLSTDFPMANIAFENSPNLAQGVGDGFIVKFDLTRPPADQMIAGTFLGMEYFGPMNGTRESSHPLVVLPGGELVVTGAGGFGTILFNQLFNASASNQPLQKFIEIFTPDASELMLGTNLDNTGLAAYSLIAGNGSRSLYSTIETTEQNRATGNVEQPVIGGGTDLLVSKFDLSDIITNAPPVVDLGPDRTLFTGHAPAFDLDLATAPFSVNDLDGLVTTHTWRIDGGTPIVFDPQQVTSNIVSLALGRHVLTLAVTDDGGSTSSDTVIIDVAHGGTNGEPSVDAGPNVTAVATSPAGAVVVLRGFTSDPDGDTLTIAWTGPFPAIQYDLSPPYFSGDAAVFALLPIGTNQATLTVDDHNGHVVARVVNVTVLGTNTTAGSGVDVNVPDDRQAFVNGFTPGRMAVHYDNVPAGLTWLRTRNDQIPPPPIGKQLGSAPYYYDVATPGGGTGNIRVCVDATGMSFVDPALARLHRLSGTTWNDIAATPIGGEAAAHLICGVTTFFQSATFALFTPANESTRVTTILGDGSLLNFAEGVAFDTPHQFLYVSDGIHIRRMNLQSGAVDIIAGNGSTDIRDLRSDVDALQTPFFNANFIAVDRAGNIFTNDVNGCALLRVEPRNNFTSYFVSRVAGKGIDPVTFDCGYSGDGGPAAGADVKLTGHLTFDAAGNLFIVQNAMANGYVMRRITPGDDGVITGQDQNEIITTIAGGGTVWPPVGDPHAVGFGGSLWDMTFGPQGDMYIAAFGLVVRLSPAPGATVIDGRPGELLSSVSGGGILKFAPFGGDNGPAIDGEWNGAASVAVLPGGDLIVADLGTSRLRRISAGADGIVNGGSDEIITTVAGFSGGVSPPAFNGDGYALSTTFNSPRKVVVDPRGGITVADTGFGRIRHIGFGTGGTGADLAVAMTGPASVGVNGTVTYHVTVTNHGPAMAGGINVSMPVAGGLAPTATSPAGFCVVPILNFFGTISCDGGSLGFGQSIAITITLTPKNIGTLTSTVTVSSGAADPVADNNAATVETDVEPSADLAVVPLAPASGSTVHVGVPVVYRVTFANHGPNGTQSAARLRAALPAGLQLVSATMPGAVCDGTGGILTCDLDLFAAGASLEATIVLTPLASGPTTITFDASSSDFDSDFSNNSATIAVNRAPAANAGGAQNIATATANATIHLSGSGSDADGDSLSYAWSEGGQVIGGTAQLNLVRAIGNYTFTLTVNDGHGGISTDTALVVVHGSGLAAPANVSAVATGPGTVTISWDPVPGALAYRILRDADPVTFQLPQIVPPVFAVIGNPHATDVPGPGFVDSGLPPLVRQYYAVEAINGSIVSLPTPAREERVMVTADPDAEIFGFADFHNHQFSNYGFGQTLIWGDAFTWSGSIFDALPTCDAVHGPNGILDIVGNTRSKPPGAFPVPVPTVIPPMTFNIPGSPLPLITPPIPTSTKGHVTLGTDIHHGEAFSGWPRWDSITHQQVYYEWLHRAFEGGMRLMVMHALNNELLCRIAAYSNGKIFSNPKCKDVDNIDDQLFGAKNLETFIDQQSGGSGKGWYRIAYSATEARHIINSGKMAVILGIEVDNLFGCTLTSSCTEEYVGGQLQHYYDMGVRHLFPVHAFDNAFGGAAMYEALFDVGNRIIEGDFIHPRDCSAEGYGYKADGADALIALLQLQNPAANTFPAECNSRGLTSLGQFMVKEMIKKGMIIDIDHMSALTAGAVLNLAETYRYAGVTSGHSGSTAVLQGTAVSEGAKTPTQLQRIRNLGGVSGVFVGQGDRVRQRNGNGITQHSRGPINDCGYSSKTFAQVYLAEVDAAGGENTAAVGFGTDFNGLAVMPSPRFGNESCFGDTDQAGQNNGVTYPLSIFAPTGVAAGHLSISASPNRFVKDNPFATAEQKPWDINFDGLAHVGLLPDFIQDLRQDGLTDAQLRPLFRSAEGYVHMWELAEKTPPVVTPPASITIVATETGGARGLASPTLHDFLHGATAAGLGTLTPLPPFVLARHGEDGTVDDQTLFGVGTTTVFFAFRNDNGNIGTATATVTVTSLVISHTIEVADTIHVHDDLPVTDDVVMQAGLNIVDAIHVHDDVLTNGRGSAGNTGLDINLTDAIHVRDQYPLSGNSLAQADLSVAEAVHVVDSPDIPVVPHTLVGIGGVRYHALDANGGDTGITVQMATVLVPGILTAGLMPSPPPPPAGFTFVGGVYDVVLISGSVTPPIELCFNGTGFTAANRVLHHETIAGVAQWVDRTTTQTPTQVCATVSSLSPFALAVRANPPAPDGLMHGAGFIETGRQHHHFVFRVSQRNGHDAGNLEYWVTDPRLCRSDDDDDRDQGRGFDGNHDGNFGRDHHGPTTRFEATSVVEVVFSGSDTVRFTGTGKWNGRPGYTFEATASDRGTPGRRLDTFSLLVKDARGTIVANVSGTLGEGNIQALRVR